MKKNLLYNFSGYPGDLYQLVPIRYLASFLSYLNDKDPDSTEVWDRGTFDTLAILSPDGFLKTLITTFGNRIMDRALVGKKIDKISGLLFALLSKNANAYLHTEAKKLIERDASSILEEGFQNVFINLWYGPGVDESLYLAKILKEKKPGINIFGIGQRVSWFKQYIVTLSPHIDAYVLGTHSDETIFQLTQTHDIFDNIPNLLFVKDGKTIDTGKSLEDNIDTKPFPDYSPEKYIGITSKIPLFEIALTNEACPYNCYFCVRPVNHGTTWVKRSIPKVLDEIEMLLQDHGMRFFRIADSTPPPGMLTELAQGIIGRRFHEKGLIYSSFSRIHKNSQENYNLLKESGLRSVFIGMESGSQHLLDEILGKKLNLKDIEEPLQKYTKAGIFTVVSLMVPVPGETRASLNETFNLLKKFRPYINSALVQPAGIFPNTTWQKDPGRFGIIIHDDYLHIAPAYPIDPLKPIKFWPPFPFSYRLMDKEATAVTFKDIMQCFLDFSKQLRGPLAQGGLNIPNIQDYGYIIALAAGQDPAVFSNTTLKYMVTRNAEGLRGLVPLYKNSKS